MKKGIVGIVCLALLFVGCHRFDGEEIEYERCATRGSGGKLSTDKPCGDNKRIDLCLYLWSSAKK